MQEKIYSFKCDCGRQLAKFTNREAFLNSGIQIMCRTDKKINFAVHRIIAGSVNYSLGKIVEFTRRPYVRDQVPSRMQNSQLARV